MKEAILNGWWQEKNGFLKFLENSLASWTNDTNTMIDVDSLNDYFANISKNLASVSNCSNLKETITPKSIDKAIFICRTDANEFHNLLKNCNTTTTSCGLEGLSNSFLKISPLVISDSLALKFNRCIKVGYFPNISESCQNKTTFQHRWHAEPRNYLPISMVLSLNKIFCSRGMKTSGKNMMRWIPNNIVSEKENQYWMRWLI